MKNKLTSRKFWVALVSEITGIVTLVAGAAAAHQVATIAGAVITIAAALGYLKTEGDIDRERAKK